MRYKQLSLMATLTGVLLVFMGVFLLTAPFNVQAQEAREYVGEGECSSCHRDISPTHSDSPHALALFAPNDVDNLLADFSVGEDVRTIQFPNEDSPRAVTVDDVAYVIGAGIYRQRFVYEYDGEFWVLPIEWDTTTNEWNSFTLAENFPDAAYNFLDNCSYCHTTGLDLLRGQWAESGVQCEACHGAGSIHLDVVDDIRRQMDGEDRTNLEASIAYGTDPQLCGQCHSMGSDGTHNFPADFVHGAALADSGYELVAADAEGYWHPTGHAAVTNMQFNEWMLSSHATSFADLQENENFEVACLQCHSSSYNQLVQIVSRIEIEDDRDTFFALFDAADIDIDGGNRTPWTDLTDQIVTALEIDPASINADELILPQLLPQLLTAMHADGTLATNPVLPQSFEHVMSAMTAAADDSSAWMGVTCVACHNPHADALPEMLQQTGYELCTSCHQSAEPVAGLHYPVKEMFEGLAFVDTVDAVTGAHFTAENGPTCSTCHLASVPVDDNHQIRNSHTMQVILPADVIDNETLQDSCAECHSEQVDANEMQDMINSIQSDVKARVASVNEAVNDDTAAWVSDVLAAIDGDGSNGIHNYAYTAALLAAVETELGFSSAEVAPAEIFSVPTIPPPTPIPLLTPPQEPIVIGLTAPSLVLLGIVGAIILISAYAFFVRGSDDA